MASTSPLPSRSADAVSKTVPTDQIDPYATMGQFSFAPATKTTVVTTTYTTTTTFPPLCINAPGNMSERDPKEYPLAHTQAPESIRKFYFESGGALACFEEAHAVSDKVQEVCFAATQRHACSSHRFPCLLPIPLTRFPRSTTPSAKCSALPMALCKKSSPTAVLPSSQHQTTQRSRTTPARSIRLLAPHMAVGSEKLSTNTRQSLYSERRPSWLTFNAVARSHALDTKKVQRSPA